MVRDALRASSDDDVPEHMRTDLFDFDLPPERIALRPASPRDSARMLVVQPTARCATRPSPICRNG